MDVNSDLVWTVAILVVTASVFGIWRLYRTGKSRLLPGIPYNETSSRRLFGDIPAIMEHTKHTEGGTFITYILQTMKHLESPLIQIFLGPFSKPLLILGDFPEANDLLIRRRDFDRSHTLGDLVMGLAPNHHIRLKTDNAWKAQRRLVQDLMTPSFLHHVAGPGIYQSAIKTIHLWKAKSYIAAGRPWSAASDINQMALDAIFAFTFGSEYPQCARQPALDLVLSMSQDTVSLTQKLGLDESVEFPDVQGCPIFKAIRVLTETVGEVQGNPFPALTWAYITRKPKTKKAIKMKEDYVVEALKSSVNSLRGMKSETSIKSAVDQMIMRETELAEREGRLPNFFSRVIIDEVFGLIFAGHETTSTTICWSLKYLADDPDAQSNLRSALQHAHHDAWEEKRDPTFQEIISTSVPYLDATIEETLRCCGTAPVVDRVALNDTILLGHHIPKGTVVSCLVTGPSLMSPAFDVEMSLRSPSSQAAIQEGRHRAWRQKGISVFDPSRWIRKQDGEKGIEFDPASGPQLAFGLGTRGCYGKRLAYLELRIALTLIFWNFELLRCPSSLSKYYSKLVTNNEPIQTYVRLRQIVQGES
ncbi:cytochrome P450 monooxygenase [Xylaria arbuscula]|nr:cytochrome P450 monooxygenase [Xylaria arbuscula]